MSFGVRLTRATSRLVCTALAALVTVVAAPSEAANPAGTCDVSPGEYTSYTGTAAELETASVFSPGVSQARCLSDIRSLGGLVVEDIFREGSGRYANELAFGKLVNVWPGEAANSICNESFPLGKRNKPADLCSSGAYTPKTFAETAAQVNALDWKFAKSVRYNPNARVACPSAWPPMGCYGDRCYDAECVQADGTLKTCAAGEICQKGTCTAGSPSTLPACKPMVGHGNAGTRVENGQAIFYDAWNGLVFDLGGPANKVAVFAVNDRSPQPCESLGYTVYLTNNPASREFIDDPAASFPDPKKWNRAKIFKIYTHGWIDNPDCCVTPKDCDPTKCTLPKTGDAPAFEADSMSVVYSLPCGISFRYAAFIAGYDGKSLADPSKFVDRCSYHAFDAEIDAVAGLNDDETGICADKDGDGFPTCACPNPPEGRCDCVDDPAVDPDAKKYYPGAPQKCDGPQYSCKPTICPTGTACVASECRKLCSAGDTKCPEGESCTTIEASDGSKHDVCAVATCGEAGICKEGEVCKAGKCVDPCAPPTKCPPGEVCKGGVCSDPCNSVKCPLGEVCSQGKCQLPCACLKSTALGYPCIHPLSSCDKKTSTCVALGCDTTTCPGGSYCVGTPAGPACKGKCEDVVCPPGFTCDPDRGCVDKCLALATPCDPGKVCVAGVCVDKGCEFADCKPPLECKAGKCVAPDAGVPDAEVPDTTPVEDTSAPPDSTVAEDTSPAADTSPGDETGPGDAPQGTEGGCGCSTPGTDAGTSLLGIAGAALALAAVSRRRRAQR